MTAILGLRRQETARAKAPLVEVIMQHMFQHNIDFGLEDRCDAESIELGLMAYHSVVDEAILMDFLALVRRPGRVGPYRGEITRAADLDALYALGQRLAGKNNWSDAAFVYSQSRADLMFGRQTADLCFLRFVEIYAANAQVREEHKHTIEIWEEHVHGLQAGADPYPSRFVAGRLLWLSGLQRDALGGVDIQKARSRY